MLSENLALLFFPRSRSRSRGRERGDPSSEAEWSGSRLLTGHLEGSIPSAGALDSRRVRPHSHAATHPRSGCALAHVSRRSSTRLVRGVYRFDSGRGLSFRPLEKTLHANSLVRFQPPTPRARARFSRVGEPMVRHSFSQMRPHTAVSSLGRNENCPRSRWSSTRLVRGEAPVRFRTWAPVSPNRTDPTRT